MSYREKVLTEIKAVEDRQAEKELLWQAISDSFEKEGASGAAGELTKQMNDLQKKVDDALRDHNVTYIIWIEALLDARQSHSDDDTARRDQS